MKKILTFAFAFSFLPAVTGALFLSGCGTQEAITEPEAINVEVFETETTKYTNEEWGFSIEIPKGYAMNDDGYFTIYSESTEESSMEFPVMNILIQEDIDMELEDRAPAIVEDIVINGVQGKKHLLSYSGEPEGETTCLVYKLLHEGVSFEFKGWECLESPIFEDVVNSFKIIPEE